ncbi:MAG: 3-dehydroquinate synthase [Lentisphaerae bacterium RIFOXYB12_FULL_65_16]|nr:MAG: 3-dehydroquinate synthase [Lentisphaerae bacterium RIFOXYA12_64_32]OGV86187.1 MAG: 3-dehydroquinate synthase [Lentisphaerae bacterium RIFOXYB12_FULL_65_16]
MKTISVRLGKQHYDILIGWNLLREDVARSALRQHLKGRRAEIVRDTNVKAIEGTDVFGIVTHAEAAIIGYADFPAGEASKTLATVETLYRNAASRGVDRQTVVLALGGGVVGDVAGFFAATFLRGIGLVQVPTTLLALVDSSVGGKVGVDLPEGKNLVGAFYQPLLVLGNLSFLRTLPARELRCGLAEVVKYGVILDADLFATLEQQANALPRLEPQLTEDVVARCCQLKADIVAEDPHEKGRRAILNYGHTFGHALETLSGYTRFSHGEAVAIGMGMAADLAVKLGRAAPDVAIRQDRLLEQLGLPARVPPDVQVTPDSILQAMYRDKKVSGGKLRLVLPSTIGAVAVVECQDTQPVLDVIGGRLG